MGFDFDRVLFDTDSFNQALKDEVDGFHQTEQEPYDEYGNYDPEKHAEMLGIPAERIFDAARDKAHRFLYPDVEKLSGLENVVIVTRGGKKFQSIKVENSGILEHVDSYIVVQEAPKDVKGIDLLVDDTEKELERVGVEGFLFDREKHSLEDAIEWVKQREA